MRESVKKTVSITGSEGFIGKHLVRQLAALGYTIVAYSRRGNNQDQAVNVETIAWDITVRFDGPVKSSDVFIHAAALARFDASYNQAYAVNVTGSQHAYRLACDAGCELFIYISSASVYSRHIRKRQLDEHARTVDVGDAHENTYARTKRAAEEWLLAQNTESSAMQVIVVRPHAVYGPGDTTLLPHIEHRVRRGRLFLPLSRSTEVSLTYVKIVGEVCHFIIGRQGKLCSTIYNIADDTAISTYEAFGMIARKLRAHIVLIPAGIAVVGASMCELFAALTGGSPRITTDIVRQVSHDSSLSTKRIQQEGHGVSDAVKEEAKAYLSNDNAR